MNTSQEHDPIKFALIKLYCKHRRFMYPTECPEFAEKFKLFVSWYEQEPVGTKEMWIFGVSPWYKGNWETYELAKILKLTGLEVLGMIEEIHDDSI